MDVGVSLRLLRRRAGLTTRQLADLAGTSHATVSAYETARKVPNAQTLIRLVTAAGGELIARPVGAGFGGGDHAREFLDALSLVELLPTKHAPLLRYPKFPGRS
jgi:transcriptional regulator with XRE-family HTH domain